MKKLWWGPVYHEAQLKESFYEGLQPSIRHSMGVYMETSM